MAKVKMTLVGYDRYVMNDQLITAFTPIEVDEERADYLEEVMVSDRTSGMEFPAFERGSVEEGPTDRRLGESLAAAYARLKAKNEKSDAGKPSSKRTKSADSTESD